jgi:DNA-binding NarL/FixJ family response regulator
LLNNSPIRVVIADDHVLFATALRGLLESDRRFEVVGVACNGEEAVDLATTRAAHVVLMDLRMPRMDGLEATRLLAATKPEARVFVVSGSVGASEGVARVAGAWHYLTKDLVSSRVIDTILAVVEAERGPIVH